MKNIVALLVLVAASCSFVAAQSCMESANIISPNISSSAKKTYDERLEDAKAQYEKTPNDADAIIWLGRRTGYLGKYKEAIRIFTQGIEKHPNDARMYRHRGHRYITIRCFDDAIVDFEKAASLVKGKLDEIEPDGLPNAKNIPTSTLQSNIWYHLGLAYYVKGDFKKARAAYDEALKVSTNPDMKVATVHWQYMTLRRLGKKKDAAKLIKNIPDNLEIIENDDYYKLIKLYQGKSKPEVLQQTIGTWAGTLGSASLGYGVGNWYWYNGNKVKAMEVFAQITDGDQWASFGYIAAQADAQRQ